MHSMLVKCKAQNIHSSSKLNCNRVAFECYLMTINYDISSDLKWIDKRRTSHSKSSCMQWTHLCNNKFLDCLERMHIFNTMMTLFCDNVKMATREEVLKMLFGSRNEHNFSLDNWIRHISGAQREEIMFFMALKEAISESTAAHSILSRRLNIGK